MIRVNSISAAAAAALVEKTARDSFKTIIGKNFFYKKILITRYYVKIVENTSVSNTLRKQQRALLFHTKTSILIISGPWPYLLFIS